VRIRCERCKTVFTLELDPPPPRPIEVQCGRCGLVFTVKVEPGPRKPEPPPPPKSDVPD
jgi:predicted Zn finger-like uncharacterized protein